MDDRLGLCRVLGPVHPDTVGGEPRLQLHQQLGQPRQGMATDGRAQIAQAIQFFGIGKLGGALGAQIVHGAAKVGAQLVVAQGLTGPLAEVLQRRGTHGCTPSGSTTTTTSCFGPWAP